MFQNIFSFEGRIRRMEYFISLAITKILQLVLGAFFKIESNAVDDIENRIWYYIVIIPVIYFIICQGAKRCHDLVRNGWWQIIPFYVIWMIFVEGDANANKYGANPRGNLYPYNELIRSDPPKSISDQIRSFLREKDD